MKFTEKKNIVTPKEEPQSENEDTMESEDEDEDMSESESEEEIIPEPQPKVSYISMSNILTLVLKCCKVADALQHFKN